MHRLRARPWLVLTLLGFLGLAILAVAVLQRGTGTPGSAGTASQVSRAVAPGQAVGTQPDIVPREPPSVDRREVAVRIVGTVSDPRGQPVPWIRVRIGVGTAVGGPSTMTDAEGAFRADLRGAVARLVVAVELADGPQQQEFVRPLDVAATDWELPPIRLAGAHSLTFEIELSSTVVEALAAAGDALQIRVRLADGGRDQRVAEDLAGPDLTSSMRRVYWFAGPATLWLGVGLREPLSSITSWFHKSERRLEAAAEMVKIVVTDAMVVAGSVVDHEGNPVVDAVVELTTTTPEPRITRARTDAAGRFLLVPPSLERGTIGARVGSVRGEQRDCGAGDRPQLTIDLHGCERVRFVRRGEPIAEPFFASLGHVGNRSGVGSAMAAYRRPHRDGVALLGTASLAAGDRVFFESAAEGERLLVVTQANPTPGRPLELDLAGAIGAVDCEVRMPVAGTSEVRPAWLDLTEVREGEDVPDRARVDYRVALRGGDDTIRSLLRLRYRFVARLPDGREAIGELDARGDGPHRLDLTGAFR